MADTNTKKPIGELRKELKHLMVDIQVAPSKIRNRQAIEHMIEVYKGFSETKKETVPPIVLNKPGRKPARKVESETSGEVAVPKKVAPVELKQEPEYKAKKMSKADPPKVADDTPKTKPKRVISPEHLAKMKAAREAKRAASSTPEKEETEKEKSAPKPKPKVAKPKKEEAPPDAPPKSKEESQQEATSAPGPREKKIPVFKMGSP
jgi:hypothetical protein